MPTKFDRLAEQTFTTITNLMGEDAVWQSSNNVEIHGRVLFKDPTEPIKIGDAENYEYRPSSVTVEYYIGTFLGLREAVDRGSTEYIKVRDRKYLVMDISTKFDGQTYVAQLEPEETEQQP